MPEPTPKGEARKIIDALPDGATWEDSVDRSGLKDLERQVRQATEKGPVGTGVGRWFA